MARFMNIWMRISATCNTFNIKNKILQMKQFFILFTLLSATQFTYGQKLDDIKALINKQQYKEAKAGIDQFLANAKNAEDADAWYYKGRTYNALSADKSVPVTEAYQDKIIAFEAFKKAQALDPKEFLFKLEQYLSYLDLYSGFYDLGAKEFNEKKFDASLASFEKALEVKDYILAKKITFDQVTLHPLDTGLVMNAAIAALQANKEDVSMKYFQQMADYNVSGESNLQVYQLLADYYERKKDTDKLQAILDKGRKLYPNDGYWDEIDLRQIKDKPALLAKYREMIVKDPNNFALNYNYAVEIYNLLYNKNDERPDHEDELKTQLTEALKNSIKLDTSIDATVLMANHLYNVAADYGNAATLIKGTKPEDVKKRNELNKLSASAMEECIGYCNSGIAYYDKLPSLSGRQKSNEIIMLGYLIDIYGIKKDAKKVAEYEAKRKTLM